jgi:hypothetical protein
MVTQLQKGRVSSRSINAAIAALETLPIATVAALAAAPYLPAANTGKMVYCSNGAAGSPCLAYCNGTAWLRVLLGLAVNATT